MIRVCKWGGYERGGYKLGASLPTLRYVRVKLAEMFTSSVQREYRSVDVSAIIGRTYT